MRYRMLSPSGSASALSSPRNDVSSAGSPRVPSAKWQAYGQSLLERGAVSAFAVYSRRNGRVWTETPDLHVTPEEVSSIVNGFTDDLQLRVQGIHFWGQEFVLTRMSWNHVMMVGRSSASGRGCVVYLCRTCVVIATHEEGPQTSLCYSAVEKLGDFLVDKGF
ncbi:profilin-2 [Aplysia californica]|uniref:Profilin n=1 Tax=Aplysia californica TaxID=6500 RepID=A0ABM0K6Q5_APLCA|nr:profilin-2 [Aplysia californica]